MFKWFLRIGCVSVLGGCGFMVACTALMYDRGFQMRDKGECRQLVEQWSGAPAQSDPLSEVESPVDTSGFAVINTTNVGQLTELERSGRGNVRDAFWGADDSVYVLSSIGMWKHSPADYDTPPELLWTYDEAIAGFTVSPDGRLLAAQSDVGTSRGTTFYIWDVETGRRLITLHDDAGARVPFVPAAFNLQGTLLAALPSREAVVWDIASGSRIAYFTDFGGNPNSFTSGSPDSLAFSRDGRLFAVGSGDWQDGPGYVATIRIWDIASQRLQTLIRNDVEGNVKGLAFHPNGRTIASTGDYMDGNIRLWDIQSGEQIDQWQTDSDDRGGLHFAPDGQYLAHWNRLFDAATGTRVASLGDANDMRFSRNGELILTTPNFFLTHEGLAIWNAEDYSVAFDLSQHYKPFDDVRQVLYPSWQPPLAFEVEIAAASPDGRFLALNDTYSMSLDYYGFVRLCDVAQKRQIATFHGSPPTVYSHDGALLANETECGINLWDGRTGEAVKTLASCAQRRSNLRDTTVIAFSPDDSMVAYALEEYPTGNSVIEFWDVETATLLSTLRGHTNTIRGIVFSDDGTLLTTASSDGTVRWWGIAKPDAGE